MGCQRSNPNQTWAVCLQANALPAVLSLHSLFFNKKKKNEELGLQAGLLNMKHELCPTLCLKPCASFLPKDPKIPQVGLLPQKRDLSSPSFSFLLPFMWGLVEKVSVPLSAQPTKLERVSARA